MAEEVEQSSWNLSMHIINQIGSLLASASSKFRTGRIQEAYWDTEEVRVLIHADLDEKERKMLDDWETRITSINKVHKKLHEFSQHGKLEPEQIYMMKKSKHEHYRRVKEYRMYMMELISKYGYSIPKKESATRMF